jgi:hypothetical protein
VQNQKATVKQKKQRAADDSGKRKNSGGKRDKAPLMIAAWNSSRVGKGPILTEIELFQTQKGTLPD